MVTTAFQAVEGSEISGCCRWCEFLHALHHQTFSSGQDWGVGENGRLCERRYGRSQLAEVIKQGIDPQLHGFHVRSSIACRLCQAADEEAVSTTGESSQLRNPWRTRGGFACHLCSGNLWPKPSVSQGFDAICRLMSLDDVSLANGRYWTRTSDLHDVNVAL